ncbi:hypothetical protein SynA15127_01954 [Synechococcus sp. A15-127]|nr:hypothetical protein SynA15127_01954 [Synechococcus sp. A15-127]
MARHLHPRQVPGFGFVIGPTQAERKRQLSCSAWLAWC